MTLLETMQDPAPHPPVRRRPRKPKTQAEQLCLLMQGAIAAAFAVSLRDLRARTRRSPEPAFARQAAMYLAHVVLRQNYRDIGRLFGRDRTTAAYARALVEERRDDPALDALLQTLENVCLELARGSQAKPEERA
jgi:chromosomal replication initiation ATPase DnaA